MNSVPVYFKAVEMEWCLGDAHLQWCCRVRVVKESDSKSDGVSPHRFESCRQRKFLMRSNSILKLFFGDIFRTKDFHMKETKLGFRNPVN